MLQAGVFCDHTTITQLLTNGFPVPAVFQPHICGHCVSRSSWKESFLVYLHLLGALLLIPNLNLSRLLDPWD